MAGITNIEKIIEAVESGEKIANLGNNNFKITTDTPDNWPKDTPSLVYIQASMEAPAKVPAITSHDATSNQIQSYALIKTSQGLELTNNEETIRQIENALKTIAFNEEIMPILEEIAPEINKYRHKEELKEHIKPLLKNSTPENIAQRLSEIRGFALRGGDNALYTLIDPALDKINTILQKTDISNFYAVADSNISLDNINIPVTTNAPPEANTKIEHTKPVQEQKTPPATENTHSAAKQPPQSKPEPTQQVKQPEPPKPKIINALDQYERYKAQNQKTAAKEEPSQTPSDTSDLKTEFNRQADAVEKHLEINTAAYYKATEKVRENANPFYMTIPKPLMDKMLEVAQRLQPHLDALKANEPVTNSDAALGAVENNNKIIIGDINDLDTIKVNPDAIPPEYDNLRENLKELQKIVEEQQHYKTELCSSTSPMRETAPQCN